MNENNIFIWKVLENIICRNSNCALSLSNGIFKQQNNSYNQDISDFKNMLALHVVVGIIFANVF